MTISGISKLRLICTLLLLAFLSIPLYAGTGENLPSSKLPLILDRPEGLPRSLFPFRSYGSEAGLGNLAVRRIVQDRVGFLWVGTEDGLYRFDGYRFARLDTGTGLPSTWITDLLAAPDGNLWICTPRGVAVRNGDRADSRFTVINSESSGLPDGSCSAIARDSRGVVWVAHRDGLFFRRDRTFQRFVNFPAGSPSALVSGTGPSSEVWAAVKGAVVRISDYRVEGKYTVSPGSTELVDSLAIDSSGRVWALSARKLFCLRPGAAEFRDESAGIPAASWRGVLSTDRSGRLWVPTDEGMSCRINEKWQHFGARDGLPTEWTRCIFEDREGSLWTGSLGVHRLVGRGSWTSWTQAQGLPSETVWHIYRSRRGDLWVATDKGVCIAASSGWRTLPGTEKQVVRRIYEDARGRIWMGLVPAAILRYDPVTKEIVRYGSSSGIAGARVLCLDEDEEGQLWAATDGGGLLRYRPSRDDFVREKVPGGSPEESFRYILRDRQNRLWVTGEHGLLLRSGGEWRRFGQKDGLLQDHISYITQMASGEFWLSYFEPLGIVRFTLEEGRLKILKHLTQVNGLSSEKVYLLGQDFNGDLWVGTGNGLDIVSNNGVRHLSKADGLAGDDIDAMAILVEPSGAVFIGTSSGLSMYRSEAKVEGVQPPQPVFLSASVGDQPLIARKDAIPSFPHGLNTLKAEFAVMNFRQATQIEYGTRLVGLETEWHQTRVRENRYPGLAPGSYTYEVRARLGSGPWSEPASISFEVEPPWWRNWPAIVVWLILAASAAYAGFRWRLRHLRNRTRQLESLVSARTLQLALANADLERLSITDPLTGLKNRRFLEFSILEDLARIRRTIDAVQGGGDNIPQEAPNISFLVIDIDHFKPVNDRFGHAAGDQVLRQMGTVLSTAVRESDTAVRWGGEEFLIIARNPKGSDSCALAERLRKKVEATSFSVSNGHIVRLTCSIGFASWPFFRHDTDALGWQEVLDLADRCLYLAKNSGRNGWMGLSVRPDYRGRADYEVLNDFREAEALGAVEVLSSSAFGERPPQPYKIRQTWDVGTA